jgi:pimeloyl-ACP methyl ester carboxylesterase
MDEAVKRLETHDTSYVEHGEGVPVVLIHGSLCDHRIWEPQRENIASKYRYIALDLRYHGTEPWPDEGNNYSAVHHTNQVIEFIDALGTGPVHVVGQSYSGHIAARAALQAPELFHSLVLQEPAIQSLLTGPEAGAILEARQRDFAPAVAAVTKGDYQLGARLLVEALINQGAGTFDSFPEYVKSMVRDNARTLPLLFSAQPAPPLTCEQFEQLKVPTLIINGAQTSSFFSSIGEKLAQCIPVSRREVIADASHGVETQNPEAYRQVLLDFLAAVA